MTKKQETVVAVLALCCLAFWVAAVPLALLGIWSDERWGHTAALSGLVGAVFLMCSVLSANTK